ncbi:hypothetical protein LCGC14_2072010, partial [marine sediment metagenome]
MGFVSYPTFIGRPVGGGEKDITPNANLRGFFAPNVLGAERVASYLDVERLLDPKEHVKLRSEDKGGALGQDTRKFWIPLDLPGMLTRLMRHYTLGEEFRVRAILRGEQSVSGEELVQSQLKAQTEIDRIGEKSNIEHLLRQVSEQLPALGDAVLRILDGENPSEIQVSSVGTSGYMFDWRQLKLWGISERDLPTGSVVKYKDQSYWNMYKWRIIGVLTLCLIEGLLIFI